MEPDTALKSVFRLSHLFDEPFVEAASNRLLLYDQYPLDEARFGALGSVAKARGDSEIVGVALEYRSGAEAGREFTSVFDNDDYQRYLDDFLPTESHVLVSPLGGWGVFLASGSDHLVAGGGPRFADQLRSALISFRALDKDNPSMPEGQEVLTFIRNRRELERTRIGHDIPNWPLTLVAHIYGQPLAGDLVSRA
jgi:hypothetical protein